jgi:hypothetical protein
MASQHHDTGCKEVFSYPEFVQQLVEGFFPPEISRIMDFSTLKNHSGNYITPLFEEKLEKRVRVNFCLPLCDGNCWQQS